MSTTPLAGLKVVDLTRVLAGPLCTQYLGLMGADVVKIETTDTGDEMRTWPPFYTDTAGGSATGSPFLAVNHNKRSLALDLKAPKGREIVAKLIAEADIVIESFALGVGARLGVSAADVHRINPRAIHCSITGFGSEGPMKNVKGYDVVLQAFSGMIDMTGYADAPPARITFSPVDQATGLNALIGILAALNERNRTGKGAAIEVSLFDSATGLLGYMMQNYWQQGLEPQRRGLAHGSLVPYQAFEASDRPIILGIANDALWRGFCKLVGRPELIDDPRFRTNGARVENRDATVEIVAAIMSTRTCEDWFEALTAVGIPCSPIHTLGELAAHPHSRASGMVYDYDHPVFGPMSAVAQPIKFDGERSRSLRAPPSLGQDSDDVLHGLGFDDAAISDLRAQGVIGARTDAP